MTAENNNTPNLGWFYTALIVGLLMMAMVNMTSCARQKVVTEYINNYVHDTAYVSKMQHDSVWMHDSIFVKADSVGYPIYTERWHTKYIERTKTDTCYKDKVVVKDSIITRTETITQTKNSGFAKFCMWFFGAVVVGAIAFLVGKFVRH